VSGVDINRNPWANPPSMGCEEPYPGSMFGNFIVNIGASATNIAVGYPINFQVNISGPIYNSVWNFGDGTIVSNQPYISHTWLAISNYPVILTAYNDGYPAGQSVTNFINVYQPTVFYVVTTNPAPVAPYDTWAKAATNIQNAVNVAIPGSLILVSNGVYQTGSQKSSDGGTNRVAVTQAVTVQSVNGPGVTTINGGNVMRCAYVTNGAVLSGFTLTSGNTPTGGGIYCASTNAFVENCLITRNTATTGAAYSGTFSNCTISYNSAYDGGGVVECTLNNCQIVGNTATYNGGGIYGGIMNNCLIASNSAVDYGGGVYCVSGYPAVLNSCVISNNTANTFAGAGGGGVFNDSSSTPYFYRAISFTNCILNNCTLTRNIAYGYGAGAVNAELNNCVISSNQVSSGAGGGVESGSLNNCTLIGNFASTGGGADGEEIFFIDKLSGLQIPVISNCVLVANVAYQGAGANYSILNQCTILQNTNTGGYYGGAGASDSTLNSCLIISNYANYYSISSPGYGGGAYYCNLTNCVLAYNIAFTNGGGAYNSTLVNCTVTANAAGRGGGVYDCVNYSSILYYNTGGDYYSSNSLYPLNYCCTSLMPTNGFRNITGAPLFVNAAAGNFQLQPNSPCINSGNNAYISTPTDLAGNPRIVGGTVDIGAYEYQSPTSVLSYAWLQQYGLPTDGSVDYANLNGTAFNVYQDWVAGLNPTNSASVLVMLMPTATNNVHGITVTWQSVSGISYNLLRSTNLPAFTTIQSSIVGQTNTTSYKDTSATNNFPYFYRVSVLAP